MQSVGFSSTYDEDSDADDEYERSAIGSPLHPPKEFQSSPSDSDPPTNEHTPKTFSPPEGEYGSPKDLITDWTSEQCADFFTTLGVGHYGDNLVEEAIDGAALIAMDHAELKELGVTSVGHRLSILKAVYDVKVQQHVNVEPEHYVPSSAAVNAPDARATRDDIARVIQALKLRDERLMAAEAELRSLKEDLYRVGEENKRLREETLPLIRKVKDQSQPLPQPDELQQDQSLPSPRASLMERPSRLSRKLSTKKLFTGSQPTIHEFGSELDPSAAAIAASSSLTSSMNGSSLSPSATQQTSPTSPPYLNASGGIAPRYGRGDNASVASRVGMPSDEQWPWPTASTSTLDRTVSNPPLSARRPGTSASGMPPTGDEPAGSVSAAIGPEKPSETFKSFRVSMDDPCHKVLPAALKKYKIEDDWRQYSLYIVYGDQERCLGWDEKPLILFKQLYREEKKPMFMLRKHAAPAEGFVTTTAAGGARSSSGGRGGGVVQFPGGVF